VEFGRDVAVRFCVRQKRGIGNLRICPALRADPSFGSRKRHASIGRGDEKRRDSVPVGERGTDRFVAEANVADHALVQNEVRRGRGNMGKAIREDVIFDVLAKSGKADFGCGDGEGGNLKPWSGSIDHGDLCERRGLAPEALPNAKGLIKAERRFKQGNGPAIGAAVDRTSAKN
jgi:hypothetical protein